MNALQTRITRMALLAVCSAALTAPLAVLAQDTPPPPPPPAQDGAGPGGPGGHHDHGGSPQEREAKQLEELTKHLSLTADQQTQVKQIFADRDAKMMALHSDTATAPQDKREKMMGIMKDSSASIRAILTPDQQTKYDAMMAKRKEEMEKHQHGGPGGGDMPPPPSDAPAPPTQQ